MAASGEYEYEYYTGTASSADSVADRASKKTSKAADSSSATEWVYTYSSISSGGTPSRRGRLCTPKRCLCLCCTLCCCFAVAYLVALLALSYDGYTDCLPPISDGADGWESLTPVMLRTVGGSCYGAVNATILPLNAVQTVGWHNSYHLAPNFTFPGFNLLVRAFDYERTSLSDQLSAGYRNFELDLHIRRGQVHVFHIQTVDDVSTCGCLAECLEEIRTWSALNQPHTPIIVQFDWKVGFLTDVRFTSVTAAEVLLVESTIADVFGGTGDVVIPDSIMGQHPSLSASLDLLGWPGMHCLMGSIMFVSMTTSVREVYKEMYPNLKGAIMFTFEDDIASLDRAFMRNADDVATMREWVDAGYIVRQRADAVLDADEDRTRINEVAGAGVQLVSLDNEPAEKWGEVFGVDGAGTVCSLVNAPDGCEATLADLNSR